MTEEEARAIVEARFGQSAADRIAALLALVIEENQRQNLIAPSTIATIWSRHALDSAQLQPLGREGMWIDVGTGGGFPGLVIALLRASPVLLVEPRRRRAEFLEKCIDTLGLVHVRVIAARIERVTEPASTISARAVSSIEKLLHMAAGCAKGDTRWLLPRGRFGERDIVELERDWRGVFHVEQSLTAPASSILVLDKVRRR